MCIRLPCHSTYHVLSTSSVFSAEFCTSKRSHSDDRREEESNTPVPETGKALRLTTHAVRRKVYRFYGLWFRFLVGQKIRALRRNDKFNDLRQQKRLRKHSHHTKLRSALFSLLNLTDQRQGKGALDRSCRKVHSTSAGAPSPPSRNPSRRSVPPFVPIFSWSSSSSAGFIKRFFRLLRLG